MPIDYSKTVSVVIPVDDQRYLKEALDSILAQVEACTEIIVIGKRSIEREAELAEFYPHIRYQKQSGDGIGDARNAGIKMARGAYLAFLDADDRWVPNKLKIQLAALEKHPDLDMVFGLVQDFISPDMGIVCPKQQPCLPGIMPGTMMVRKASFERVGFFEVKWVFGEFIHWYAKAHDMGLKSQLIPEVFLRRRIHRHNAGIVKRQYRTDYARAVRAILDRRRAFGGRGFR